MAAQKKITDFIKSDIDELTALVQGYVPPKLRADVVNQMKKDKLSGTKVTWDILLEASLRAYLAERERD